MIVTHAQIIAGPDEDINVDVECRWYKDGAGAWQCSDVTATKDGKPVNLTASQILAAEEFSWERLRAGQ